MVVSEMSGHVMKIITGRWCLGVHHTVFLFSVFSYMVGNLYYKLKINQLFQNKSFKKIGSRAISSGPCNLKPLL